jgi:2,4-dienoyl-CoA reductase-like NADH-dependent reductase (Old Yellow Enzyme family)
MTLASDEISDLIERFGRAACIAKLAGFSGVQVHGAHGCLVSQFLSPHHNQRHDRWGGAVDNRMRFVLEVYRAIRRQVGDEFPSSIKLNAADVQHGGFSEDESMATIDALGGAGIGLVEVSGGNDERPRR